MQGYYARQTKEQKPRNRLNQRTVVTVQQGDTLPSLAEKAGVTEKDITDLGVKQVIPGQVLNLTSAFSQRDAEAHLENYKNQYIANQEAIIAEYQSKLKGYGTSVGPGAKGAGGARRIAEQKIAEAQAEIARVTSGAPAPGQFANVNAQPTAPQGPASRGAGARQGLYDEYGRPLLQETPGSRILNWGKANPEPTYYQGFSPADQTAWQEQQRFKTLQDRWNADHPQAAQDINPVVAPYAMSGGPSADNPELRHTSAAMMGGKYIKDGRGNYVWLGNPGTPPTDFQRVMDSQAASLSLRAIDYAITNELWDRLPTSISPGAAQMLIGHTILLGGDPNQRITLDLETLSMLGYSLDDNGALIHEELDEDVQFTAGYGDYTGGYGGGGGGGGSYEEKIRYYTGGNVGETSGRFARGGSQQYQHLGVGTANWRI